MGLLNKKTVELLIKNNLTVSTAESCTGGLIGKLITDISGASKVYNMGFITYSNEAKSQLLGVPTDILQKFGAVSKQTVLYMAKGARKSAKSSIAVSVSGIAGPKSDDTNKPVGLVFIGFSCDDGEFYLQCNFDSNLNRDEIRYSTAREVLDLICLYIENREKFVKFMKKLDLIEFN